MHRFFPDQSGVASRRQLLLAGLDDADIRRLVRRRELAPVLPGVYVDHTGPLSWGQRAWAGVLWAWPAALSGASAIRAVEGPRRNDGPPGNIEVAIAHGRSVRTRPGLSIVRRRDLEAAVSWTSSPPRLRYEVAVLDVALSLGTSTDAIAIQATACGSRRTTAERLSTALDERRRAPGRARLGAVLDDIGAGTRSVLEHDFLTKVERPHHLPAGQRQVVSTGGARTLYRDLVIGSLVVELDGREFHTGAHDRARDLERDLDASLGGHTTVRLGWAQVHDHPCRTAAKLGALLQRHGWNGQPRPCGPGCDVIGVISSHPATGNHPETPR